jgi:malonyl CoA-acyl carrier protein transacylase
MRPVNLRSRIEALERRASRNAPSLAAVTVYEDDDAAAVQRWLNEFEASTPNAVAIVIRMLVPRPPDQPPFWRSG